MTYSASYPQTAGIDFSSAFDTDKDINFSAVGESVFPTENILGVNKNMDTINRIAHRQRILQRTNLPITQQVANNQTDRGFSDRHTMSQKLVDKSTLFVVPLVDQLSIFKNDRTHVFWKIKVLF